ncbi:MAG: CoB--CoM heterodisulfide reductase iron-sulfur subunit B family protein [Deltaproteobacteria bacterium]|nr:CoB--CoM heterodisulfide reductase iron-sulfur subunit B family protein [Deltaproteobacteria bacterium]
MKYAFFLGCNIPARLEQYETASRAVLSRLGVGLVDYREFTCCGYPLRNIDRKAYLLSAAGNLALAERDGVNIMALCKCCFGTLKEAQHILGQEEILRAEINDLLAQRNLSYQGQVEVKHFLSVLYHDVGIDTLKKKISRKMKDLNIATHYGCHALRPSKVTQFDDPVAPTLFDELVTATGAKSVEWAEKLNCCGAPLLGLNDSVSMDLTRKKLDSGRESGADFLCTACPYCQLQFDQVQHLMAGEGKNGDALPSILYAQLLGLCMGVDEKALGLKENQVAMDNITSFFITQE